MRKIFTLLLSLVLLPLVTWGQEITGYWTDEGVREEVTPDGTVYKISTPGQLGWISWKINEDGGLGNGYEIVLLNDIDLSGHYWIPMSVYRNFKGNNHTIQNIAISAKEVKSNTYLGFFNSTNCHEGFSISDLTLEDVTVNPEKLDIRRLGTFTATLGGNMKNCHVKNATIHVSYDNSTAVGGFAGTCENAKADNCSVENVTILIEEPNENTSFYSVKAGGFAGYIYKGGPNSASMIRNCSVSGTIKRGDAWTTTTTGLYDSLFGGLFGEIQGSADQQKHTIENCYSSFSIELDAIPLQLNKYRKQIAGGLCGSIAGFNPPQIFVEISNCVYNGKITPDADGESQIGYLFGWVNSTVEATATVNSCFHPSGTTPVGDGGTYTEGIAEIFDGTLEALNQWVTEHSTEENEYRTWNTDDSGNLVFTEEETSQPVEDTDYTWNENRDVCTLLTPKGLLWFVDQVNNQHNTFTGKTVMLAEGDWDMTSENWIPIGNKEQQTPALIPFSGTFDGNNQTVKIKGSKGGFFGCVKDGTILNLTVDGTLTEVDDEYVGMLVGSIENGTVSNVTAKGSITNKTTGTLYIGGVVGETNKSKIMDCTNEVAITISNNSSSAHGGIAGYGVDSQISGCINKGDITSTAPSVGGIIGNGIDSQISDCINDGDIEATRNNLQHWAGGIAGMMEIGKEGATSVVSDCINNGSITSGGSSSKYAVGGIIGATESQDDAVNTGEVTIINSINNGEIKATTNWAYVGGIVGITDGGQVFFPKVGKINSTIINCLNTGTVTGTSYVSGIGTVQAHEAMNTNIEFCINQGVITGSGTPTAIFAVYSKKDGTVTIKDSYYQAQSGLEATAVDQEGGNFTIENLQEIPTNKEWLADLNESISAYNTAHPDELKALYWVFDANDKLTFGVPAPTIEDDTPFEESTEITINVLAGTTVYYTTDGTDPTTSSTEYSAPFEITETTTVKAIAVMGEDVSAISEATFKTVPKAPVILTESTTFDESITVTITAEEDAAIYYTTDGSDPTSSSELYNEPLTFTETTTLKVIAVIDGVPSEVVTVVLTKNEPEPEPEEPDTPVTPDYPDYYNIYVEECEGVTVETSTNVVREGNSMSFTVEVADGYMAEDMVVKVKRSLFGYTDIIEPNEEGKYEIRNIYTEIYITVEGVEKETPTGIEELQSTKVYAKDGSLYVQTPKQEEVRIISISGAVIKNETQIGLKRYDLPRGIYIVRVGEETYKVRN